MTQFLPSEQLLAAARRFAKAGFSQAQSIAGSNLSRAEWQLLWLLHQQPKDAGARPSDLARQQRVTAGSIAQTLKTLEAQELIARTTDTADRRVVLVTLTPKGVQKFQEARQQMTEIFAQLVASLGKEDARTFTSLLTRAADILETQDMKPC